jgi:tryptophan 2,3-dioxygenase
VTLFSKSSQITRKLHKQPYDQEYRGELLLILHQVQELFFEMIVITLYCATQRELKRDDRSATTATSTRVLMTARDIAMAMTETSTARTPFSQEPIVS